LESNQNEETNAKHVQRTGTIELDNGNVAGSIDAAQTNEVQSPAARMRREWNGDQLPIKRVRGEAA